MIEPRTLKGFRDFLPESMMPRERVIDTARRVYRSYGFAPIDTPALEYLEILTGKGSDETDRLMYRFKDHGDRDVGMRFDLTVPLARFVAQHAHELGTPFKRYHIAKVWRGENTHRGRYREFMQCDFDTIGTVAITADIEMVAVIDDLIRALGIEQFTIHINHRQVLNGVLEKHGLLDKSTEILRALDKLAKIGRAKVTAEMMATAGATCEQAEQILQLAEIRGTNEEVLAALEPLIEGNARGQDGVQKLAQIVGGARAAGVADSHLRIDVSIARGLDYYTGTVVETFLDQLPNIGSICSGGRYDDLAGVYTKQKLPGVGASLGLDRLLAALEELGMLEKVSTPAPVLLVNFDDQRLHDYLRLAAQLRAAGIGVEFYPESKKMPQQLKYADRRGFQIAIIAGENEFMAGACQLKNLRTGHQETVPLADHGQQVVQAIRAMLASPATA